MNILTDFKNIININKTLTDKLLPIYLCTDLYDGLILTEVRLIIIDYICELTKVNFDRSDFIDNYVGWTSPKTIKLLEHNRDKIVMINDIDSLVINDDDKFGMEAVHAIKIFTRKNENIILIFK
jgi:hypothetical protein